MTSHKGQSQPYIDDYQEYEAGVWNQDKYRIVKSYAFLRNEKPRRILDVGCLAGRDMLPILNQGTDCYGVELTGACGKAIERGIECVRCDIGKGIPFSSDVFDVVWAEEIIEHVLDTDYFLQECSRVMKNGGRLVLSTPNLASLINRVRLFLGKYPRYMVTSLAEGDHVRHYTLEKLKRQLSLNGFHVERIVGNFLSFPDPTPRRVLRRYILAPLGTILPSLSENVIFLARKALDSA